MFPSRYRLRARVLWWARERRRRGMDWTPEAGLESWRAIRNFCKAGGNITLLVATFHDWRSRADRLRQ